MLSVGEKLDGTLLPRIAATARALSELIFKGRHSREVGRHRDVSTKAFESTRILSFRETGDGRPVRTAWHKDEDPRIKDLPEGASVYYRAVPLRGENLPGTIPSGTAIERLISDGATTTEPKPVVIAHTGVPAHFRVEEATVIVKPLGENDPSTPEALRSSGADFSEAARAAEVIFEGETLRADRLVHPLAVRAAVESA